MKTAIKIILTILIGIAVLFLAGNYIYKKTRLEPPDQPQNVPTEPLVPLFEEQTPPVDKRHDKGELTPKIGGIIKLEFTTLQISEISLNKKLDVQETELLDAVLNDKTAVYDLSKISPEEIVQNYKNTLTKLGDDFKNINEGNLAIRIKNQSRIIKDELAL